MIGAITSLCLLPTGLSNQRIVGRRVLRYVVVYRVFSVGKYLDGLAIYEARIVT